MPTPKMSQVEMPTEGTKAQRLDHICATTIVHATATEARRQREGTTGSIVEHATGSIEHGTALHWHQKRSTVAAGSRRKQKKALPKETQCQ